ncbi:MarR family transcriptional regulator [Streptomyces sp. ICN441]|uniref:MarR family winged helix-turn-helix transcriptional regulator n=1 Tax=Streptomyces sp. ICN441 TaxID=2558286 RepID=UPI00106A696D|nr:MarR family transcriptional regulator [Streptomyces sp. ICN441]TFE37110.1 MarR family transcriptional regulator [Streptomyces sp. ICN441]
MTAASQNDDEAAARAANSRPVRDFGLLIKPAVRLERRIDTALRRECGISHTMLEVLILLFRRSDRRMSQRQLADEIILTSSGTTRLIDRMEEAGLVRRLPSPEDRRVALVEPTIEGRTTFLRAAAVHAETVEEYLVKPLSAEDQAGMTRALSEIDRVLREAAG